MENVKHFVLVDAACFGEWHWYKLSMELKSAGHRVTTIDLGTTGFNTRNWDETVTLSEFLQPLTGFLASLKQEEKVILVGHSYGGLSISLAMEQFPEKILVAVFASAYMPHYNSPPGNLIQEYFNRTPLNWLMDTQFTFDDGLDKPPTSVRFGPNFTKTRAYKNCSESLADIAHARRRTTRFLMEDLSKDTLLTKEKYGSVDRVYVVCDDDDVLKEDFQRMMIDNFPPKEVRVVTGADHMVMLSKYREFSQILEDIALKY